jgi:hypothetical protein
MDIVLGVLPVAMIWGIKLSLRKRIAMCVLLGLGPV